LLNTGLAGIVEAFKARMPAHGKVGYTTNGMLMDEARAAQLVDAGTNWICFSLDGAKRATAESIRIGIDFERVIKHIGLTVERRRVSGRKNLWLTSNFVIMDRNLDEMSQMVRLAASLGLDSISFNYHRNFRTGVFSTWSEELLQPRFEDVRKLADSLGVDVLLPRIGRLKDPRCTFMQMAYLHLSGEVVPCCRMLPGGSPWPIRSFGNVRERPLLDIWHSSEYVEFRSRVADGDFPEVCVKCDYKSGLLV
jgi:radical SAM protein with 4Fe4S-binding SPASM domain